MTPFPFVVLAYILMPLAFFVTGIRLEDSYSALLTGFFFAASFFALILAWKERKYFFLGLIPLGFSLYLTATQIMLRLH